MAQCCQLFLNEIKLPEFWHKRIFYNHGNVKYGIISTMEEYIVTTRNEKGSLTERTYRAESRADLFKQLSADGIVAVRIEKNNGNKRTRKTTSSGTKNKSVRIGFILSTIIAVAAVISVFVWINNGEKVEKPQPIVKKPAKVVAVKPSRPVQKPTPQVKPVEKAPEPKKNPAPWRNKNLTDEQREEAYVKALSEKEIPKASTNRLFRTGLEQVMSWVFTTEVGDMPPPLPNISDFDIVHLQEILEIKNKVSDTDTDKQADAKEVVDYAKKELKKYLDKGGDPQEFLAYYHDQLKSAYQERKMAQEEVIKVLRTEPELVDDYLKKVNENLSQRGIKGVVIPERLRRRIESEMSRQ